MISGEEALVRIERLRMGQLSWRWFSCVGLLALVAGWGVFAYSQEFSHGLITSGLRTVGRGGATWGLYIAFAVYFIGLSFAGITVAALARLFSLQVLHPVTRIAELLAIVSLILGGTCIVADLGRPLQGLLFLPLYARPSSPFFGTFTLVVAGYLFASLVYFYLAGRADAAVCARVLPRLRWFYRIWASGYQGRPEEDRRHLRSSFWLSIFILPLLVTAHSTLGFVFGIQSGRPGWFSALQAPSFVILAGSSGIAMLIVISALIRRLRSLDAVVHDDTFQLLCNLLWTLTLVYLYFMIIDEVTASYAAIEADGRVAHEVVYGVYSGMFWSAVFCFAVPTAVLFVQFARGRPHVGWAVAMAVLVNVGAILKRFLIVVPSQTHGMLLPFETGHYVPSWIELSVVAALFAVGALCFLVFAKLFPIVPFEIGAAVPGEGSSDLLMVGELERSASFVRAGIFAATLLAGVALAVVGFLLSLRVGTQPHLDPVVPYSPVIFAFGVMLIFGSAAVYETLPPAPRRFEHDPARPGLHL